MKLELLGREEVPEGFAYPSQFLRLLELGIADLEPWRVLHGGELRHRISGLRARYPSRVLVPFAGRIDNDDIACWDLDRGGEVSIVHDFASAGWEQQAELKDTYAWLRQAVEDLIEYDDGC